MPAFAAPSRMAKSMWSWRKSIPEYPWNRAQLAMTLSMPERADASVGLASYALQSVE